ncbi:MAG: hypothetical protein KC731_16785 [Myxococcales bacterium]|nr:hypothetical protein [Myxococcales bacterium]
MLFPNPRACSCLLLTAVLAGCSMPKTATYEPGVGRKFCSDIANHAQLVSTQEMGVGVFLLTVGGASLTASGVLATISANSENNRQLLGYVGAGLAVAPLIAVPFGMVLLSRSDEASALAAAANTAIALSETDEDAYRDCVLAKAAWVGSRADATALARKALEDERERQHKHDDEAAEEEQKKIDAEAGTKDEAPKESEDAP